MTRSLFIGVGAAVLAVSTVLIVLAGIAAYAVGSGVAAAGSAGTWGLPPQIGERLHAAAENLTDVPATRFRGTVSTGAGQPSTLDVTVANNGTVRGTMTVRGERLEVFAAEKRTYVRAPRSYWIRSGAPANTVGDYAKQWVKVPPSELGVNLPVLLAPITLQAQLDTVATGQRFTVGEVIEIDGVQVRPITSPTGTIYVTTTEPAQIVRIVSGTQPMPTPSGTADPDGDTTVPDDYQLDLTPVGGATAEKFLDDVQKRVQELRTSLDSSVRFALAGNIVLAPCSTNGCLARGTIRNTVASTSPYVTARAVTATVTITMTLDARPIKNCVQTITMPPNGIGVATCAATYNIPPSRNPTTHTVRAQMRATARAVVDADVKRIADDLARERKARADQDKDACSLTGTMVSTQDGYTVEPAYAPKEQCGVKSLVKAAGLPTAGRVRYVPPAGADRGLPRSQGGFTDRFGNTWVSSAGGWEVRLTPANQARYRSLCPAGSGGRLTRLTVDAGGEVTAAECR